MSSSSSQSSSSPQKVKNFMDGTSFNLTPLMTLKFVAASSIFGEPSYYRDSDERKPSVASASSSRSGKVQTLSSHMRKYVAFPEMFNSEQSTVDVFIQAVDNALESDFKGTLEFAKQLRNEYNMRLNPNVILVRASLHRKRVEFNKSNPKLMKEVGLSIIQRPDDMNSQLKYYISLKGGKNHLPNILKRIWAEKLSKFPRYQLKKYLQTGKLVDLVRISHANSENINEMMKTGDIKTTDEEKTWETLKASGKTWNEIVQQINMPHMALLRNLRGMEGELDKETLTSMCDKLVAGVEHGKQFPYRYYSAYQNVTNPIVKCALDRCINKAMTNFPRLKGKTISLCDNSGSAHGTLTSSYGSTKVSTIANLSGVMTAVNSDSGEVGVFGDQLVKCQIDPQEAVLKQLERVEQKASTVGRGTENGVWLFFDEAIKNKLHYDNIFIYSDMQASHGGLYGSNASEYKDYVMNGNYIDVLKLVETYREKVNPKANVFTVQVAGYNNNLLPENTYRGSVLSGWTGNEVTYAKTMIELWDQLEEWTEV